MIRLDEGMLRRTRALIERYGMHDDTGNLPVPIKQVARNEGWVVNYRPNMGGAIAMAFCIGPIKLMFVNENLTAAAQRVGIAHEMAHVICQHGLSADTKMMQGHQDEGFVQASAEQEQQAILVGSMLLIPESLMLSPFTVKEVALMCQVTTGSVREYRAGVLLPATELLVG